MNTIDVYLEIGEGRTFAGAIDWPGWRRGGRDEAAALQALFDYGPRYARALRHARLSFEPPAALAALRVVERLPGGAGPEPDLPARPPAGDAQPVSFDQLRRLIALLRACWKTLDVAAETAVTQAAVAQAAAGQVLRPGPAGGRELAEILQHVQASEARYLERLGGQLKLLPGADPALALRENRKATLRALEHAALGDLPLAGPDDTVRWPPRYFVRCAAGHVLDHAWEIEEEFGQGRKLG